MKKNLYYVKYEVIAENMEKALKSKGKVYEIVLATEQPTEIKKIGFKK